VATNLFDDPRITAVGLLFEAQSALTARFAVQFAEHGLSQVEFEVLIRLARSLDRRLRMTDLAAQTALSTSGVTRVVDRLERDGLVARHACDTDRRISYAQLTKAGLARLEETLPGHLELIDQCFTGQFCAQKLDELLAALRTVRDALRIGGDAKVGGGMPEATAGARS
jgi:MarR family transcriptional regulator, 2-MHQ and catechol-resistance regulon repressor